MAVRLEVNGRPPTAGELVFPATVNYGHVTAMQVRGRAVRGLDLHLTRLREATRSLWDGDLDTDRVRAYVRHALGEDTDASVRILVHWPDGDDAPSTMVTVRPPAEMPAGPLSLESVEYQRAAPHLKHVGGFGQIYYGQLAQQHGFDDALFVGSGGVIAEGAITNVAFFDGGTVVWPDAPALAGITMQLLEPRLPSRRAVVRLRDLPAFQGMFVTNSRGVAPVGRVDDQVLPVDATLMDTVMHVYEDVAWDDI